MNRERLPWGPLVAGYVATWLIFAGLSFYDLRRPDGPLSQLQDVMAKFGVVSMPNPWTECPKEATTRALPFFIALLAGIRLRSRGWEGVALTLGLAAFAQWLLTGFIWNGWSFWRIAPPAAAVAALPAGDWIARGKDSGHRRIVGLTVIAGAFILAGGTEAVVMVLWKWGRHVSLDVLFNWFLQGLWAVPRYLLPFLPMIGVWYLKIPPLPKPQPAAA